MSKDDIYEAYWQGQDAANDGADVSDNPYDRGSICFREWEKGFLENTGD